MPLVSLHPGVWTGLEDYEAGESRDRTTVDSLLLKINQGEHHLTFNFDHFFHRHTPAHPFLFLRNQEKKNIVLYLFKQLNITNNV